MKKGISKRAQRTLELIRKGRFYMSHDPRNPATIKELEDAGLIRIAARPIVVATAYVPVHGYHTYQEERFDDA